MDNESYVSIMQELGDIKVAIAELKMHNEKTRAKVNGIQSRLQMIAATVKSISEVVSVAKKPVVKPKAEPKSTPKKPKPKSEPKPKSDPKKPVAKPPKPSPQPKAKGRKEFPWEPQTN